MATPPPGPKGEHLGRLNYEFWRTDMFGFLKALSERYGDVVSFDLGRSPCILVNGALEVRELFFERETCLRKPEFVKDSNRGHWGDGLTTLEGVGLAGAPPGPAALLQGGIGFAFAVRGGPVHSGHAWTRGLPIRGRPAQGIAHPHGPDRCAGRCWTQSLEGYGPEQGRSGVLPFAEAYGEEYVSTPGGDPTAPLVMMRPRAPRRMDATVRIIDERIASGEERGDYPLGPGSGTAS